MESARTLDGTGCEFDSWQCRIYVLSHVTRVPLRLSGYIWLDTKIVVEGSVNSGLRVRGDIWGGMNVVHSVCVLGSSLEGIWDSRRGSPQEISGINQWGKGNLK